MSSKTAALKKAQAKYKKSSVKVYRVECYPTDADISAKLEAERQQGGYATYIKELIRKDLAKTSIDK